MKKKCYWVKVDGTPCTMQAMRGSDACGNHDPDGKYAKQHPERRIYLLERIKAGTDRMSDRAGTIQE